MFRLPFFRNMTASGGTLTQRVIRGGFWNIISSGGERLLGLVRTVILARLLLPADFGLLGIALILIGGLHSFTITGIQPALIQRREVDASILNTAWVISIFRGFLLSVILVVSAPFVADFFKEPRVIPIIRLLALNQIFGGLRNIGFVLLQKELNFKQRAFFDITAGCLTTFITIGMALILRNFWALIMGEIAGGIIRFILSYRVHPFRPRFQFDFQSARPLLRFGKHVFASTMIIYVLNSGDDAFIGKMLGPAALGFYILAYQLASLPATGITHIISAVAFPAYSKLQDDVAALREAYLRILRLVVSVSTPIAGFLAFLGPELVRLLYGERWAPMVPALQVLCIHGFVRSISATTGPMFFAVGRPEILTKVSFVALAGLMLIIYPLTQAYSILGTALAVTIFPILTGAWCIAMVLRIAQTPFSKAVTIVWAPLVATVFTFGLIHVLKAYLLSSISLPFQTFSCTVSALVIYPFLIFLLDRTLLPEVRSILKTFTAS